MTSSKVTLLNTQLAQSASYQKTIDTFLQDVDRHIMDIRRSLCLFGVTTQKLR